MMRISVVRATTMGPILTAMAQINVPTEKLLDEARLPQIDCCNPNDWVSSECLLNLGDLARRKAEIPSFAFLAAQAGTIADMGQFGKHLIEAPNLGEALNRYCENHIYYRSSANCYLMRGQKIIWLCHLMAGNLSIYDFGKNRSHLTWV